MRARLLCAAFLAVCLPLGGCGVPTDREPRPIQPSVVVGSYEGPIAGPPPSAGAAVERLFLVRDNQLVAVDRRVVAAPSPQRQLEDLMAGPTPQERDEGLDSALVGTSIISGVQLHNGTAIVGLARDNPIRNDEILAYGQIVCTLAARADVVGVRFVQDGRPLEVPRADSALTLEMLTEDDYGSLIHHR
ncbi:GerMN domain-containing protein [Dactylosporangium sp. NPDC051484]|uniref:GerMN domain-containing protein n=1 Tax=Dactylosporangium sp. NPDC051484 TaxID=3154942 RepID=UPI00344BCFC2